MGPKTTIEKYGADAFRLYILHSPITKAEPIYFNEISIKIMFKKIVLSLINSYLFFAKYANIDKWQKENIHTLSNDIMDIWIISKLNTLIKNVKQYLSKYNLFKTIPLIIMFIDDLTNWYIRLNRRRFWK